MVVHNTTISNRMLNVFRDAIRRDPELSKLSNMLCSPKTVDNEVTSGDLKTYAKITSEIHEADKQ